MSASARGCRSHPRRCNDSDHWLSSRRRRHVKAFRKVSPRPWPAPSSPPRTRSAYASDLSRKSRMLPRPTRRAPRGWSDVADRLRHLLAGELEEPVVGPDPREGCRAPATARARSRDGEDKVEPAAVDLEGLAEQRFRHRRALDVPAGPAHAPRRVPGRVLARPCAPSRARSRGVLLGRVAAILRFDCALPGQAAVAVVAGDAEVDVAVRRIRVAGGDESSMNATIGGRGSVTRGIWSGRPAQRGGVLEVPLRRALASSALAPGAAT